MRSSSIYLGLTIASCCAMPVFSEDERFVAIEMVPLGTPTLLAASRSIPVAINENGAMAINTTVNDQASIFTHAARYNSVNFRAISYSDVDGYLAVGNINQIARSIDDGVSWSFVAPIPVQSQTNIVRRVQAITGISSDAGQPLLRVTTKGGIFKNTGLFSRPITWTNQTLRDELAPTLRGVAQAYDPVDDIYRGVIVGDSGTILVSTSFGETWEQETFPASGGDQLQGIAMLSPNVAIAVGNNGGMWMRNFSATIPDPDGDGSNWNKIVLATTADLHCIATVHNDDGSDGDIVVGAADGTIWRCSYSGVLLNTESTLYPGILAALAPQNWTKQELSSPTDHAWWSVASFRNGASVISYAVGAGGQIARSEGGAWTIERSYSHNQETLLGVAIRNNSEQAMAVGITETQIRQAGLGWTSRNIISNQSGLDLGVLDISSATPGFFSQARAIGRGGDVVGSSHLNATRSIVPTIFTPPASSIAFNDQLDPLFPYKNGAITGLNNEFTTVGYVENKDPRDPLADGVRRPFYKMNDTREPVVLSTLSGGNQSWFNAISQRKTVNRKRQIQVEEMAGGGSNNQGSIRAINHRPQHLNDCVQVIESTVILEQEHVTDVIWGRLGWPGSYGPNTWHWYKLRHNTPTEQQRRAWYTGAYGAIFYSDNNNDPYAKQVSNTNSDLYAIDFYDFNRGVAVGQGGVIRYTTDAGVTWETPIDAETGLPLITTRDLYDVHFVKGGAPITAVAVGFRANFEHIVFACGAGGTVLKSIDGGASWRRQVTGVTDDLFAISFPGAGYIPWTTRRDAVAGWAVGDQVAITTNSSGEAPDGRLGESQPGWTSVALPTQFRRKTLWGVDAFSSDSVYMTGEEGLVLRGVKSAGSGAGSGWSFVNMGGPITGDLYDIKVNVNNYTYNNGAEPQFGSPRSLPAPFALTVAPDYGIWNQWKWTFPEGQLSPVITVAGESGGMYMYLPWNTSWQQCSTGVSQDMRGVDIQNYAVYFDSEDNDSRTEPDGASTNGSDTPRITYEPVPEAGNPQIGYNEWCVIGCSTDGRGFSNIWSNDSGSTNLVGGDGDDVEIPPNYQGAPVMSGVTIHGQAGSAYTWNSEDRKFGILRDLGTLHGVNGESEALDIDDEGTIVGYSKPKNSDQTRAMLIRKRVGSWEYDVPTDLGTLGGGRSKANAISRTLNRIVGSSTIYNERIRREVDRAMLHENNTMYDLNALISASKGWIMTNAVDINETGEILAEGFKDTNNDGVRNPSEIQRAFILHPLKGMSNLAPIVTMVHPSGGEAFEASANANTPRRLILSAIAQDHDSAIAKVEFYVRDALIGSRNTSVEAGGGGSIGHFVALYNIPANITVETELLVEAIATDALGRRGRSKAITIKIAPVGQQLVIRDLGSLGGDETIPRRLNNNGDVVGYSINANGQREGFLYTNSRGMIGLGMYQGDTESDALTISDLGHMGGRSFGVNRIERAVYWPKNGFGIVPNDRSGAALKFPIGLAATTPSKASGVNTLGNYVGSGRSSYAALLPWFAVNEHQIANPIGTDGGVNGEATAINPAQSITGWSETTSGVHQAFKTNSGYPMINVESITRSSPGIAASEGRDINYRGDVVGWMSALGGRRGFVWNSGGSVESLPPASSINNTEAFAIQDGNGPTRWVVGREYSASQSRAKVWISGVNFDLTEAMPTGSPFSLLESAVDVNNSGQIAAVGILGSSRRGATLRLVENNLRTINTPPTVVIANPLEGAVISNSTNINIAALGADGDGVISRVDFWLVDPTGTKVGDNLQIGSVTESTRTNGVDYFSVIWNNAPVGKHQIVAIAVDNLGSTAVSAPISLEIVGTAALIKPEVEIHTISGRILTEGPQLISAVGPLSISGTTTSGVDRVEIWVSTPGGLAILEGTATKSASATVAEQRWDFTMSRVLNIGTYTMVAVAHQLSATTNIAVSVISEPVVFYLNPEESVPRVMPRVAMSGNAGPIETQVGTSVQLNATVLQGDVTRVRFYAGPYRDRLSGTQREMEQLATNEGPIINGFQYLGEDDDATDGFTLNWPTPVMGFYAVYAVGIDNTNERGVSLPQTHSLVRGPRNMRIVSQSSTLAANPGSTWTYVVEVKAIDLRPEEQLTIKITDLQNDDSLDINESLIVSIPLATEGDLRSRLLQWTDIRRGSDTNPHVRFRIQATLDNGDDSQENDPSDVQDVLIHINSPTIPKSSGN